MGPAEGMRGSRVRSGVATNELSAAQLRIWAKLEAATQTCREEEWMRAWAVIN